MRQMLSFTLRSLSRTKFKFTLVNIDISLSNHLKDTLTQRLKKMICNSIIQCSICLRLRLLLIIYACSRLYHFSVCTDRLSGYRRPLQSNKHKADVSLEANGYFAYIPGTLNRIHSFIAIIK